MKYAVHDLLTSFRSTGSTFFIIAVMTGIFVTVIIVIVIVVIVVAIIIVICIIVGGIVNMVTCYSLRINVRLTCFPYLSRLHCRQNTLLMLSIIWLNKTQRSSPCAFDSR